MKILTSQKEDAEIAERLKIRKYVVAEPPGDHEWRVFIYSVKWPDVRNDYGMQIRNFMRHNEGAWVSRSTDQEYLK